MASSADKGAVRQVKGGLALAGFPREVLRLRQRKGSV